MERACRAEIQAGVVSYVKRGQMPGTCLEQNNHRGLKNCGKHTARAFQLKASLVGFGWFGGHDMAEAVGMNR